MKECSEADWKLFRMKIAGWQERYMETLNARLAKILTDETLPAGDRFWKAEKMMSREKKTSGVTIEMSRNLFKLNLLRLLKEKVIMLEDLSEFSPELQEEIRRLWEG